MIVGLSSLVLIGGLYQTSFAGINSFPIGNYAPEGDGGGSNTAATAGIAAGAVVGGVVIYTAVAGGAAAAAGAGAAGGGSSAPAEGEGSGEGEAEEAALNTELGPVTAVRLVPSAGEVEPGQRFAVDLQVKLRKDGRWHRAGNRPEVTLSLQDPQGTGVMRFGNGGNRFSVPITLGPSANGRQVTVVARFAPADQPVRTASAVIRLKVTGEGAVSARR